MIVLLAGQIDVPRYLYHKCWVDNIDSSNQILESLISKKRRIGVSYPKRKNNSKKRTVKKHHVLVRENDGTI